MRLTLQYLVWNSTTDSSVILYLISFHLFESLGKQTIIQDSNLRTIQSTNQKKSVSGLIYPVEITWESQALMIAWTKPKTYQISPDRYINFKFIEDNNNQPD